MSHLSPDDGMPENATGIPVNLRRIESSTKSKEKRNEIHHHDEHDASRPRSS
jgi:hypothetical protein